MRYFLFIHCPLPLQFSVRTESMCVPDAVDTACSSSLVTTHLAAKALMSGEVAAAASMGVNLTLVQSWTRACLRAGMLSEEGRCAYSNRPTKLNHLQAQSGHGAADGTSTVLNISHSSSACKPTCMHACMHLCMTVSPRQRQSHDPSFPAPWPLP